MNDYYEELMELNEFELDFDDDDDFDDATEMQRLVFKNLFVHYKLLYSKLD